MNMTGGGGGGGGGSGGSGSGGGNTTNVSGTISSDQTWSGTVNVTGATTIASGATVTVDAGTLIEFQSAGAITVAGTLDVQGTAAAKVNLQGANSAAHFNGIAIMPGGTYNLAFGVQYGGGIHLSGGATTITDSKMWNTFGDYLTSEGPGAIDVSYSQLGDLGPTDAGPSTDTTHCDMHFGTATSVSVTHSNIATASYGLMLYTGTSITADLTNDNWYGNSFDIEPGAGNGKVDGGYFKAGAPTGSPALSATGLSTTPLTDAGPRG
jgi:hypothetical protein